jgi:hypothetical protein
MARPRDIERGSRMPPEQFCGFVLQYETRGGTLFADGEPIVTGGLTLVKPPYALAWIVASRDLKPYLRHVLPEVKSVLAAAKGMYVCATIMDDQPTAARFATKLGFEPTKVRTPYSRIYLLKQD